MPEGDTVHKLASTLREELVGRKLSSCLIRGVYGSERLAGARIDLIEARGKHMLVHFDRDLVLRVHLGMKGSWHRYKRGSRWKRSKSTASVVLETEEKSYVLFQAMDIELIPAPQLGWHRGLQLLGQDLLAEEEPDWGKILEAAHRFRSAEDLLGEVLLDQRVAAGIGNVYKSELAFMGAFEAGPFHLAQRGVDPWRPLGNVDESLLIGLFKRARPLLQANLGGWPRTTRVDRRIQKAPPDGNLFVYGREGEKCFRCGEKIEVGTQGLQNRVTYWCPGCQP